jgi:hypothetical protein
MVRFRAVTLIALIAGVVGTMGFFLRAGQRTPRFLLALMAIWVLAPFAVLLWAYAASLRWAPITRATLYVVMWVVALGSLAVYGDDARGHRRPQAAFVYVIVPPASWALMVVALSTTALVSGRRARRRDAA